MMKYPHQAADWVRIVIALLAVLSTAGCRAPRDAANAYTQRPTPTVPENTLITSPGEYVLGPGDVIDLKFFYQPELNDTVTIRPDGKISPQLIDEVHAAGMTVPQLKSELSNRYAGTLKQAVIAVSLKEAAEQRIFVGGEVNLPGVIPLRSRLTALQALMQAGGMKTTAETRQVVVLRNQGTDRPLFMKLNLDSDLSSGNATRDLPLQSMDILFVPKTTVGGMDDFMEQYVDKLVIGSRSVGAFYNINGGTVK